MSKIKLTGSNSGYVEISSAADAGNLTLNLPTSGTALLSNGDNVYTGITTFSNDLKLEGGSYDVLWDSSDNQLEFGDNAKLSFGASSDLQIFHDGNNSFINEVGSGSLYVRAQNTFNLQKAGTSDFMLKTTTDGAVDLYFANSKKFETSGSGVIVTGICTATSFSGSGEDLTRTTQLSHRNIVINGDMRIAQRGTSGTFSNAGVSYPSIDRMKIGRNGVTGTFAQVGDAPAGKGFHFSAKMTTTSAVGSIAAGNAIQINIPIERHDVVCLGYGVATAKTSVLSFYVKSSLTGSFGVAFSRNSRVQSHNITYSSANTWQFVEVVVPGDTATAINGGMTDTGMTISITISAGNNTVGGGAANSWINFHNAYMGGGATMQHLTNNGSTFQITGVQFEIGSKATPFEHRSYGEELRRCQRYYEALYMGTGTALMRTYTNTAGSPTNVSNVEYNYKVEKRVSPTWSLEGNATWHPSGTSGMSAYPSKSTCMFQRNDTTHQFLADGVGDLCGSFSAEL